MSGDTMQDDSDLRARTVALEHHGQAIDRRVSNLETWRSEQDIAAARIDERWNHIYDRFNRLESKISGISSILSRIMWIVISAIIVAIIGFMIKGGFA